MAKYERIKPPTVPSWIILVGVLPLVFGIGFTMTGYTNFWAGVFIMGATDVYSAFAFWLTFSRLAFIRRCIGVALILVFYVVGLWYVFVPAPLDVLLSIPDGNYPVGTLMYGVFWKAEFFPVNVVISNETDYDYNGYDSYIRTDVQIAQVGIGKSINQCVASIENPHFMMANATLSHKENGKNVAVPVFQEGQQTISTFYRIRCDKIAAKSRIDLVIATIGNHKPSWAAISSQYFAAGRNRHPTLDKQCFAPPCDMPESL